MKEKLKCCYCGEEIKEYVESEPDPEWGDELCDLGKHVAHNKCIEDNFDYQNPSALIKITPDDVNVIKFDNYAHVNEDNDYEAGTPSPIKLEKWVASSAWRGYIDWEYENGYEEYAEGWTTGWADETIQEKADLNDLLKDLCDGELKPPCPIYIICGMTSNVFSTSTTILIHKDNKEKIEKWLTEILNKGEVTILDKDIKSGKEKLNNMLG